MPIPINSTLVRSLVKSKFGSIDSFAVHWEERAASGQQKVGIPRDRSTIYRWLDKGIPSKEEDVFGFASAMDIDPVSLLPISSQKLRMRFAAERRLFLLGLDGTAKLSAFWPIYRPGPHWPDSEVALSYYGRKWCVEDFTHDPEISVPNVYAGIEVVASDYTDHSPRVYHIAYRRRGSIDNMWRPFGSLVGTQGTVELISESGDYQKVSSKNSPTLLNFETYFGPGPADFRICSLHRFQLRISVPSFFHQAVRFIA